MTARTEGTRCIRCTRPVHAKGLCQICYMQDYRAARKPERNPELLTTVEAARYLGYKSHGSITYLKEHGWIRPAGKTRGYTFYRRADLDKLRAEGYGKGGA